MKYLIVFLVCFPLSVMAQEPHPQFNSIEVFDECPGPTFYTLYQNINHKEGCYGKVLSEKQALQGPFAWKHRAWLEVPFGPNGNCTYYLLGRGVINPIHNGDTVVCAYDEGRCHCVATKNPW